MKTSGALLVWELRERSTDVRSQSLVSSPATFHQRRRSKALRQTSSRSLSCSNASVLVHLSTSFAHLTSFQRSRAASMSRGGRLFAVLGARRCLYADLTSSLRCERLCSVPGASHGVRIPDTLMSLGRKRACKREEQVSNQFSNARRGGRGIERFRSGLVSHRRSRRVDRAALNPDRKKWLSPSSLPSYRSRAQ